MNKICSLPKTILFMIAAATVFYAATASAAIKPGQGAELLMDAYQKNVSKMETSSFGLPLYLDSFERGDRVHVDVYGIFNYTFINVSGVLATPANWCDIVSLHPNVKACTYSKPAGSALLTFYIGNKAYQPPEDTRQVTYKFRNVIQQKGYLDVTLSAESGPFGTEDHKMRFEALQLDGGKTFVHVSYEYSDSIALRLASKVYFATVGRDKVGFTETGSDGKGNSVYIGGPRGSIERNAVRYYFAIQSYMNTRRSAEDNRFNLRISEWYDLTIRYRRQLFDLDKSDYLTFKTAEQKNQIMLQKRIESGHP